MNEEVADRLDLIRKGVDKLGDVVLELRDDLHKRELEDLRNKTQLSKLNQELALKNQAIKEHAAIKADNVRMKQQLKDLREVLSRILTYTKALTNEIRRTS